MGSAEASIGLAKVAERTLETLGQATPEPLALARTSLAQLDFRQPSNVALLLAAAWELQPRIFRESVEVLKSNQSAVQRKGNNSTLGRVFVVKEKEMDRERIRQGRIALAVQCHPERDFL